MNSMMNAYVPLQKMCALVAVFSMVLTPVGDVFATPSIQYEYKTESNIKICHGNATEYSDGKQEVDAESILNNAGHDGHNDKGIDDKGDIISSFAYEYREKNNGENGGEWLSATYAGKNLTTTFSNGFTGQQILDNDCNVDDTTITIVKKTIPEGDKTPFSFTVDDVVFGSPIKDGESTGPIVVSSGYHHEIDEIAVPGWTFVRNMEVSNCVDEENNVIGSFDGPYYLTLDPGDDVVCTFTNTKDTAPGEVCDDESANNFGEEGECEYNEDIENSCFIPSTKGDNADFEIGISPEKPLQTILNEAGFGSIHVENDQMNYQVWDLASDDTESVAFTVKVLSKNAGNVETFGYYKAGDTTSFVPVFTIPPTDIATEFFVTIPSSFADSVGFAIQTDGVEPNTWYSEFALNTNNKDNLAVYNPSTNTYVLGFEDLQNSDNDYNDLVVEIEKVECSERETSICQTKENILLNGSFEADPVSDHGGTWQIFASPLHWMVSLSNGLELWADGFYGGASEGDQNAELDGNSPTQITQTVATIPGATYELRFDFSARPDADSSADNSVDALIDGNVLMNATANGTDIAVNTWSTYSKTFVAQDVSTDVSLRDVGIANSYGSLIDNVCLLKVEDPEDMYTITGYKWHDLDKDGEKDENEPNLEGWTIEAEEDTDSEDPTVYTGITNADGYYAIEVPRGTWIVSEIQKEGWIQTSPVDPNYCSFSFGQKDTRVAKVVETHVCNFGNYQRNGDNEDDSFSCSLMSDDYTVRRNEDFTLSWDIDALETDTVTYSWISEGDESVVSPYTTSVTSDTTFTITLTRGEGEGEEVKTCSVDIDVVRGGGNGGGGRRTSGEVQGDSTTRDSGGEVLGATTDMPVGAPNTGAGGTSPVSVTLPTLTAILSVRTQIQKNK